MGHSFINQLKPYFPRIKQIFNLVGWVIGLILIGAFCYSLYVNNDHWGDMFARLDWSIAGVSIFFLLAGQGLFSLGGYVIYRFFGLSLTPWQSYRFWFIGQLAKYLPGGVWQFAVGIAAYTQNGAPIAVASATTILGIIAVLLGALFVSFIAIFLLPIDSNLQLISIVLTIFLVIGTVILMTKSAWGLLFRWGITRAKAMIDLLEQLGSRRLQLIISLVLLCVTGWVLIGAGFYLLLVALQSASIISINLVGAITYYAIAWVIGFVVLISPSGLGPREAIISAFLAPTVGSVEAFSIAMLARIWWTIGDALHISFALLVPLINRRHQVH